MGKKGGTKPTCSHSAIGVVPAVMNGGGYLFSIRSGEMNLLQLMIW